MNKDAKNLEVTLADSYDKEAAVTDKKDNDDAEESTNEKQVVGSKVLKMEKNIQDVNFYIWVICLYFGNVDSTSQTFEASIEIQLTREMIEEEYESYLSDKGSFEPFFEIQVKPMGTVSVESNELQRLNDHKSFSIADYRDGSIKKTFDFKDSKYGGNIYIKRIWISHCIFSEVQELESFPFDIQHFEMMFAFRPDPEILYFENNVEINCNVKIDENQSAFRINKLRMNITGWDFIGLELPLKNYGPGYWKPIRGFIVILKRSWRFYFYRVILILFLLGLVTLNVFTVGYINDTINDRFGFISTTLLTVIAYMFIIKEYLPQLNYLTLLDYYIYFILFFITMVAIQCFVSQLLFGAYGKSENENSEENSDTMDIYCLIIDTLIYIIAHLVFLYYSLQKIKNENLKIKQPKFSMDLDTRDDVYCIVAPNVDIFKDYVKEYNKDKKTENFKAISYFKYHKSVKFDKQIFC